MTRGARPSMGLVPAVQVFRRNVARVPHAQARMPLGRSTLRSYDGSMSDQDEAPKSALEIAMARLRQRDTESGESTHTLTDEQKARIAEVRQTAQAKLAQEDILFKSSLAITWDPDARAKLEAEHRHDLQRIHDERDSKVEKIRRG